ncbi:MAG: type II toxin-antitoxin system death-on-curing family toxin [Chloroflexota bacterium]|nr:type II toxin-antitoxin system death-on-curing family toxin [Chloroflexota bacterium]
MPIHHLELDEALRIHERAIYQYGGSPEMRDLGLLESALATPRQTMFREELYPDVVSKAAILVYLLIKNHPFVDGNKRTGLLCLLRFLAVNGFVLDVDNDDLYQFTVDVATSKLSKDAIGAWLNAHLRKAESRS